MPYKDPNTRRKKQREYMRIYTKTRYARDPAYRQAVKDKAKKRHAVVLEALSPVMYEFRKNGCRICGEKEFCCLVAHHIDPSLKEIEVSNLLRASFSIDKTKEKLISELKKCICLCHNCHSKVHADLIQLEESHY